MARWHRARNIQERYSENRRVNFLRYVEDVRAGIVTLPDPEPWTPGEWGNAVAFAYRLTRECRPWTKPGVHAAIRERYGLPDNARLRGEPGLVNSLITDPIRWHPGSTQLDNGQHRLFAAQFAGQPHVLARTD